MTLDEYFGIGTTTVLGSYRFDAEAIKEFARKYDPQPFHTDEEAARGSVFGRLCASGWHTAAVWMKLNLAHRGRRVGRSRAGSRIRPLARLQEPEVAEAGLCRGDRDLHPHRRSITGRLPRVPAGAC